MLQMGLELLTQPQALARTLGARGMIPFDQQLRTIVAAVSFASPRHARVTSPNGAQRDIVVAGERDAFGGLAIALYADHYCLLPAAEQPTSETAADFLAGLRAANPVAARHQDGWTIVRADAGGVWIVDAAQQPRFATLNEIVPLANAMRPGLPVRLVPQRDVVTGPNGHFVISGRPGFDPQTGRQVRFYWNLAAEGAAMFLREIGIGLERRRIRFRPRFRSIPHVMHGPIAACSI